MEVFSNYSHVHFALVSAASAPSKETIAKAQKSPQMPKFTRQKAGVRAVAWPWRARCAEIAYSNRTSNRIKNNNEKKKYQEQNRTKEYLGSLV